MEPVVTLSLFSPSPRWLLSSCFHIGWLIPRYSPPASVVLQVHCTCSLLCLCTSLWGIQQLLCFFRFKVLLLPASPISGRRQCKLPLSLKFLSSLSSWTSCFRSFLGPGDPFPSSLSSSHYYILASGQRLSERLCCCCLPLYPLWRSFRHLVFEFFVLTSFSMRSTFGKLGILGDIMLLLSCMSIFVLSLKGQMG